MILKNLKKSLFIILGLSLCSLLCAQTYSAVDVKNEVYSFLEDCELQNYCDRLSNVKPYTKSYVVKILNQIKETLTDDSVVDTDSKKIQSELELVNFYLERFEDVEGLDFTRMSYRIESEDSKIPVSFVFNNTDNIFVSSGFYNDSSLNSTGYDFFHYFNFAGDIGKIVSYRASAYAGSSWMELKQISDDYVIGYWWYEDDWRYNKLEHPRTIKNFKNYNVLPYSYKKVWDGSIYPLKNLNHSGLEGWADNPSLGFGMYGDLRASFFDDMLTIGAGRFSHEWAAMDDGSSLVLNKNASPYFGIDGRINLFKILSLSTMTGVMEFPNADYINNNAWYYYQSDDYPENGSEQYWYTIKDPIDSYFFQNMFSIAMIDLDYKYLHLDFGSGVVWPKRLDLGYMFPLLNQVIYQNSLGDYDNLSLFGDIKGYIPGIGKLWLSVYIDEIDALKTDLFEKTRCMFAYQAGTKISLPWIASTTVSLRYTKLEPYCYTHQAIKTQPWYDGYMAESYTNNGKSLGYYLEPNSDEIFVRAETRAVTGLTAGLQYQLIRHGADYGSGQVPGSSIWSEMSVGNLMDVGNREYLRKYFLHDGAYEWSHIIALDASYNFRQLAVPFKAYAKAGYVYDYFTRSEGGANEKTPYHRINTTEYPTTHGFVFSIGVQLFSFEQFN